ncbi:hypothetical protein NDU88_002865 [Pleurodeles waltl]|uniref:Lamina-associated polypeptide 2 alpha C-terminal domain-containing protein n=1 Tax=Pleurodeles waltl TaxID=8319 RepID=A0AAV7Q7Z2_PLEWA|nr:hypothetical protein NDU88_002865 [Pleurodeles waltl]
MASSGLAVWKLAEGELLLSCLARHSAVSWCSADGPLGRSYVRLFVAGAASGCGSASLASRLLFHAGNVTVKLVLRLCGAVIRDSDDKKVDVSLKKAYAGTHLALRTGIYGTYVAQSLLSDLKALNSALDGSSDCSGLMSLIEHQVEILLDISFDVVWASALAEGACVFARRNLVLRDWKMDAAQWASALLLPFQGNVLFGAELEEKLHKLFKEKKHSSSSHTTLGDRRLFGKQYPVQAPSR